MKNPFDFSQFVSHEPEDDLSNGMQMSLKKK